MKSRITVQLLLLVLALVSVIPVKAQGELEFRGRLVKQEDHRSVANAVVRGVGVGDALTDDDGVFRLTLPKGAEEVRIELGPDWEIVYPTDGRALVPRRPTQPVEFIVRAKRDEKDLLRREISRLRKTRRLKDSQIDSLEAVLGDTVRAYRQRMTGKELEMEQLQQRLATLADSLQRIYVRYNMVEIHGALQGEWMTYLDRLKNLRDRLTRVRDAFLHPSAMQQFNEAVERYNEARVTLYSRREQRIGELRLFWEREEIADLLEELYRQALDHIHPEIILPLNKSVGDPMRAVATGRSSRMAAQPKAVRAAEKAAARLNPELEKLEQMIRALNTSLRD